MSMETNRRPKLDDVIFGEIQVLLAEKRTALASLRTGIAVFALPLSVLSALIATSRYYSMEKVMPLLLLLLPLLLLNLGLVVLGTWLVCLRGNRPSEAGEGTLFHSISVLSSFAP
jgi:hypothetical protein